MTSWSAVEVTVSPEAAEAVEHAFNVLGSIGTEINDLRKGSSENIVVVGYFDDRPDSGTVDAAIGDAFAVYAVAAEAPISVAYREVPQTDWLAEWKKHWRPSEVGPFVIAPPWAEIGETDKIVIRIEPNMAFGTGTHETTQLCLDAVGRHFHDGMSLLDVGTGTGILAIAAAKLAPASRIVACDLDADSVMIARQNAAANSAPQIEFYEGTITNATPRSDLVCANLTLDVITPLLPLLVSKTRQVLLLSGILAEQTPMATAALRDLGLTEPVIPDQGEWIAVEILLGR